MIDIDFDLPMFMSGALLLAGLGLVIYGAYKLIRRWLVVKVRMPLIRRFRYRPARPDKTHYRIDS